MTDRDTAAAAGGDATIEAAEALCALLERTCNALVALDTPALLAIEQEMGEAVASVASRRATTDPQSLARAIGRGREALLRCRRLGIAFMSVAQVRLALCDGAATYSSEGVANGRAAHVGSSVKVTI